LRRDPLLSRVLRQSPGLRVPGAWDGFELAVRAILGQQVSVKGATTLAGSLVETFGEKLPGGIEQDGLTHLFPRPERLAHADVASIGMPRKRGEAIRALARAVCEGSIRLTPDLALDAARESLTALPGIGPWTAEYIAMRALRAPDAFPSGDLVLRRVAAGGGKPLTERALVQRSESWRPWRSYAVIALWRAST
jgi:AraC family transcriptional regulator of adaptative response / DNA-3-methyladenine glycosylase II